MRYNHLDLLPVRAFKTVGKKFTKEGGGKGDSPPPPDYVGAANATAAGNREAAIAQTEANRVNQYTPYGNLVYNQYGTSSAGNPLWEVTQSLSPSEQQKLNLNNQLSLGLLDTANQGLNTVNKVLSDPAIDQSKLTSMPVNPGETYADAANRLMQPNFDRQQEALRQQMANQGIGLGTDAYSAAERDLADQQNRARLQATMAGMGQDLTTRQQGIQEQAYMKNYPLNVINALRTGNQVQNPNFVNVPQQSFAAGPDILGATQAGYNAQVANYNAQQQAGSNFMGGLMSLGSAAMGAPTGTFSGPTGLMSFL